MAVSGTKSSRACVLPHKCLHHLQQNPLFVTLEAAVIRVGEVQAAMSAVDRALFVPEGKISRIPVQHQPDELCVQSLCRCPSVYWIQCHHLCTTHACTLSTLHDGLFKTWQTCKHLISSSPSRAVSDFGCWQWFWLSHSARCLHHP